MNQFKLIIEVLDNENYGVTVFKYGEIVIQRAYQNLGDVISLIPIVFLPKQELRNIQESGKDETD
jgi:hypothetical protein